MRYDIGCEERKYCNGVTRPSPTNKKMLYKCPVLLAVVMVWKQETSPRWCRNGMPRRWPFRSFPAIRRYRRPRQM